MNLFFQPNHLIGLKQNYLKLSFFSQTDLIKVRKDIHSVVRKNQEREKANTFYNEMLANSIDISGVQNNAKSSSDYMEYIIDIRFAS